MPPLDKAVENEEFFFKALVYGPSQSRKTLWAGRAVEAGFNVTLFEGDGNAAILRWIKPELRKLLTIIDVKDELNRPIFWPFISRVFKQHKFAWDEQSKDVIMSPTSARADHSHIVLDMMKAGKNDLFVFDSYTALASSVRWNNAILHKIDLAQVEKLDWDIYGPDGVALNWWLPLIKALKCHVIVIGHVSTYEKKKDIIDAQGKKQTVTDWSRTQPISSSGSHAMMMAKYFTDCLRFNLAGQYTRIKTEPSENADGGSRFIPPSTYTFEDSPNRLQFIDMLRYAGITPPGLTEWQSEAVKYFPPGVSPEISDQPKFAPVTNGAIKPSVTIQTGPSPKPLTGMAALMAKKNQPVEGDKK